MNLVNSICVYCGSGSGNNPAYGAAAKALGADLANRGIRLIYGGGSLGLMGITAKSVLANGGEVTGIIPQFLCEREQMLRDAQSLIVTDTMHERKMLMFDKADAFVALPGGVGTLEELVEMTTWAQLGRHNKPIVLANIDNFWAPLIDLLDHMRAEQFIREELDFHFEIAHNARDVIPCALARAEKLAMA